MRSTTSIALLMIVLIIPMMGCLGEQDSRYSGGTIDAVRVNNTTNVPVHEVTREELDENEIVYRAVEDAHRNGTGGGDITESEAEEIERFLNQYEPYRPDRFRKGKPAGYYFEYRGEVVAVYTTVLQ